MSEFTVTRYHDFSAGHRVVGHENKCALLHGHNYRIYFTCRGETSDVALDKVGRVIDFGIMKELLCEWLEANWDHRMLLWHDDPWLGLLEPRKHELGITIVPFNPTAENMAEYLVEVIAPKRLNGTGVELVACEVQETRKCTATYCVSPS